MEKIDFQISLSVDEYRHLLILMGYGVGAARENENEPLASLFIGIANAVNRENPRWTPYKDERETHAEPQGEK
jgi:hypothetical protein